MSNSQAWNGCQAPRLVGGLAMVVAASLVAGCPAPVAGGPGAPVAALGAYSFSLVAVSATGLPATSAPGPVVPTPPHDVVSQRPDPATPGPIGPGNPGTPASGGSGGSGGGSSSGGGTGGSGGGPVFVPGAPTDVTGTVHAAYPDADGPAIAGATVRAIGGAEAVTGPDGTFTLAGVRAGAALLVTAPGHVPAVTIGWDAGPLDLHLAIGSPLATRFESFIPIAGDVTLDGEPAPGAIVIGANDVGTHFGPLVADAHGHFEGHAVSLEGFEATELEAFALVRPERGELQALGLTTGIAVGPGTGAVTIAMGRTEGHLHLDVTDAPDGDRLAQVFARAPRGFKLSIASWDRDQDLGDAPFVRLPGCELVAQVEVASADGRARSVWHQVLDDLGGAEGSTRVPAALLPFPPAPSIARSAIAEGLAVSWPATAGAGAYRVAIGRENDPKALWEAYTPEPRLTFAGLPALDLAQQLQITAMEGPGAGFRHVAALPEDGPRRLRWFVPDALARYALRTVPL